MSFLKLLGVDLREKFKGQWTENKLQALCFVNNKLRRWAALYWRDYVLLLFYSWVALGWLNMFTLKIGVESTVYFYFTCVCIVWRIISYVAVGGFL